MDVLHDFCCHFFFDDPRITVDASSPQESAYSFEPLLLDEKLHPYVKVKLGDAQASVVWDSGASITIGDLNFIKSRPDFFAVAGQSTGTDATGTQVETPMYTLSSASIGGYTFPPIKVAG